MLKKENRKNGITMVISAAMAASVLFGCISVNAEEASDIHRWILEEDPEAQEGEVNFWTPFKDTAGVADMVAAFNEIYPNIKVNINTYNNNVDGNLSVNTAMMAGEVDVLHSFGLSNTYKRWENGLYMDLSDFLEENGIDLVENWGTDQYLYDSICYTLPAGGLSFYVSINMNEWENAGMGELPREWTWDEYLEASEKLTHGEGEDKVYGGSDYHSPNYFTYTVYQVNGKNQYYNEDGTSSLDSDLVVNALIRECKAENEDGIWYPKASYIADNLQTQQIYLTGKAATAISPNMVRFIRDQETYPVDFKTAFAPWPVEEAGQTNYMSGVSTFSHVGIASNCADLEASEIFLKWYSTYGCKYLIVAGHMPTWKGTDAGDLVSLVFGSEEEAEKLIDVESFERVCLNFDGPSYIDDNLTAYSEVNSALVEYAQQAFNGVMSPEEAMQAAAREANEAIEQAQ